MGELYSQRGIISEMRSKIQNGSSRANGKGKRRSCPSLRLNKDGFGRKELIMDAGLWFGELLEYEGWEMKRWKEWFAAHPEALERRVKGSGE